MKEYFRALNDIERKRYQLRLAQARRYEVVAKLRTMGLSMKMICSLLNISEMTVRSYLLRYVRWEQWRQQQERKIAQRSKTD